MYTVVGRVAKLPHTLAWDCWQCIYHVISPDLIGIYVKNAPEGLVIERYGGGLYITSRGRMIEVDEIEIVDDPADEIASKSGNDYRHEVINLCRAWLKKYGRAK